MNRIVTRQNPTVAHTGSDGLFRSIISRMLFMCVMISAGIRAEDEITWVLYDFPPVAISINGEPGNGYTDEVLKLVISRWPEARHQYLVGNTSRFWSDMAAGKPYCNATALRNSAREELTYFSTIYLVPPPALIIPRHLKSELPLTADGEVRLPELLAHDTLQGLLIKRRSYGPALDTQIASHGGSNTQWLAGSDLGMSIPRLLLLERADWSIEFDSTLAYLRSVEPGLDDIISVPIAGASTLVEGGFVCPRTPWGLKAITRINEILLDPIVITTAYQGLIRWQTEEIRRVYKQQIDRYYQTLLGPDKALPKP